MKLDDFRRALLDSDRDSMHGPQRTTRSSSKDSDKAKKGGNKSSTQEKSQIVNISCVKDSNVRDSSSEACVTAEAEKPVDSLKRHSVFNRIKAEGVFYFNLFLSLGLYLPLSLADWVKRKLCSWCFDSHLIPLFLWSSVTYYFASLINMTYPLFALCRLFLGTLYPAYASYKAVRTKNVREYVKWMMYWIVFAAFSCIETFTDIFVAFWFPFYYEVKILILIWLISPVSKGSLGSSIIYRKFVHPALTKREEEIDKMIDRLQEQGYNTVTKLAGKAFRAVSDFVMQTAIRGGGGLVHTLRKSYSLTDLGNSDDYDGYDGSFVRPGGSDRFRSPTQITDITDEYDEEESSDPSVRRRLARTSFDRKEASNRGLYFAESDPAERRQLKSPTSRETPRIGRRAEMTSPVELTSGYSSSTAELASFLPIPPDEMMDTGDYELYNPRLQGFRNAGPVSRTRSFGVKTPVSSSGGQGIPARRSSKPKQEEFYSFGGEGYIYHGGSQAYPIQHSSSVPMRTNAPTYWSSSGYSSSMSTTSVDSLYSTEDNEDDDMWSDTYEDVSEQFRTPFGHTAKEDNKFGEIFHADEDFESDDSKTPVTPKYFDVKDLHSVSQKLEEYSSPELMVYPVHPVAEKPQPTVSMKNRTDRGSNCPERPPSRAASVAGSTKKQRAPDPPVEPKSSAPLSYPQVEGDAPVKHLSRPLIASSPDKNLENETKIQPKQAAFTNPIPKTTRRDPSVSKSTIEEKKAPLKYPQLVRPVDPESKATLGTSSSSALSTSPSSNKCPHCKIHSWLPHSAGCPNKKS